MEDVTEPFGDEFLPGEILDDCFLQAFEGFPDDFLVPFGNAIRVL